LSYTTFSYTNLRVAAETFSDVEGLTVSVDVTNTGHCAGAEVVQVYVHDQKSSLVRPPKELKGFARVHLQPGETKTVSFKLDFRAFAFYHPAYHRWITENGKFDILIGASSADIRYSTTVMLQSTLELPCILNNESTLREWLDDPHGEKVITPYLDLVKAELDTAFGGEVAKEIGVDPMSLMIDTPLVGLLYFFGEALPQTPEEMVDGLLAQAHQKQ
jgi:beta-glucosidase